MSYRNYIIQDSASIEDIQQATKEVSEDLCTLCRSSNINKWAKFKPVRRTEGPILGQTPLIDTVSQWDKNAKRWKSSSTWWQADNGKCGLSIPYFNTNLVNLCNAYLHKNSTVSWEWVYQRLPNTEAVSNRVYVSRQMDFYGYNSNARPPIHDFRSERVTYYAQGTLQDSYVTISAGFNVQSFLNGASLSLQDLNAFSDYYFGVVLVDEGDIVQDRDITPKGFITTSSKVSTTGFLPSVTISIGNAGLTAGHSYCAIGYLTDRSYQTYQNWGSSAQEVGDIYSIGLPSYRFSIVNESEWLAVKILNCSSYNNDTVTGTLRLYTWRKMGQGNNSDGNQVWVYSIRIEGKFASSSPSGAPIIDDGRIGEPVLEFRCTNQMPLAINCGAVNSNGFTYYDLSFGLDNKTDGTGRMIHPLRYVIATATLYHGGDGSTVGTWNNINATKEVDSHRYTLSSGN